MNITVEIDKAPYERVAEFLAKLSELSEEYQIFIGGCGCCGSPYLQGDGTDVEPVEIPLGKFIPAFEDLVFDKAKGIYSLYMGYQFEQLEDWLEQRTKELKNESIGA